MVKISGDALWQVQAMFKATYVEEQSEDRVLIYQNATGDLALYRPRMSRSVVHVECDVQLTVIKDGQEWDLIADLHSHHIMGGDWSPIDDANERLRGILFGLFSWKEGHDVWLFRRWNGQTYEPVMYNEVVAIG
ncbi:MAG: hypothetical protein HY680_06260 [Chloroflexi bacterium]|nr:hypothetical protein [Chloroflexota bacterium]